MKDIHTFVILAYNESDDLEDCIKSVMNQSVKTNVIVATSTKNDYILELASNYGIGVMINNSISNKGNDYNFAINSFDTELVTIAHQDDLYDRNYVKEILECYKKNQTASIIFTNYYEVVNDNKVKHSKALFKKRLFINHLKYRFFQDKKVFKLKSVKYEKSICTSSVTFVKKNINGDVFPIDLIYNNDWLGFINLANQNTRFVYLDKKLVGYRVYDKSYNDEKIREDILIYKKLWPHWLINYLYKDKMKEKENEKENM